MNKIETTIHLLKKVIKDPNCKRMNKAIVIGFLGELIVKNKLEKELGKKDSVKQKGRQGKYDLEFSKFKIDVKTSTLKDEHGLRHKYWGWALAKDKDKNKSKCTHFVCLALNEKYDEVAMYIIPQNKVVDLPEPPKRFKNVKKGFMLFPKKIPPIGDKVLNDFSRKSKELLDRGTIIKLTRGKQLSKKIK